MERRNLELLPRREETREKIKFNANVKVVKF